MSAGHTMWRNSTLSKGIKRNIAPNTALNTNDLRMNTNKGIVVSTNT